MLIEVLLIIIMTTLIAQLVYQRRIDKHHQQWEPVHIMEFIKKHNISMDE